MKKIAGLFILIFSNLIFAQNTKLDYPKLKTQLTLPVSISIPEINSLINQTVTGVIYEDDSFTDNDNDQFKVKVVKNDDIKLTVLKENRLLIEVPLRIWAVKGYGALGHYVYQDTEFGVKMKFISEIGVNTDWKLSSKTFVAGFDWTEKPIMVFSKIKIPIAPLVENSLKEQQQKFTSVIDDQIADSFDLKPYLLDFWNQFAVPFQVSEEYNAWLKLTPESVSMTPLELYSDIIKTTIGINLYSEVFIGKIPVPSPLAISFPKFKPIDELPSEFNLQTTVQIPYEKATELARHQFLNDEFELSKPSKKIKIEDISVFSDKQSVAIEVKTIGELNGTVWLSGFPYYDEENHQIKIKDIHLQVKTKNLLQKTGLLLFKGKIKRRIEEEYGIPLKEIEDASKKNLVESFNKEYHPGIFLNGRVTALKPAQILLFDEFITVVIDTRASLKLNVREISFN